MTERGTTEQRRERAIGLDPFTVPAVTHVLAAAPVRARVVVEGTVGSTATVAWAGGPVTEHRERVLEHLLRHRSVGAPVRVVEVVDRLVVQVEVVEQRLLGLGVAEAAQPAGKTEADFIERF